MTTLPKLTRYIDELLNAAEFDDYCVNGVQVEGCAEINRVITGVSVSERLIQNAVDRNADAVIVHHGLFWKNSPHPMTLTGYFGKRVKLLHQNDISLLGYHLPLDAHPAVGNNAIIANLLKLQNTTFIPIEGTTQPIAAVGDLPDSMLAEDFFAAANRILNCDGMGLALNQREIKRVFVLSGGGAGYFADAAAASADVVVTGELSEHVVRAAEECGLSLYAAGHYNSEKYGIQALGGLLEKQFDLEVEFIDIPNPV